MTAVIMVIAVVLVFEVCCLVDIARAKEVHRLDGATWALICLATLPLGGLLYLTFGRKWRGAAPLLPSGLRCGDPASLRCHADTAALGAPCGKYLGPELLIKHEIAGECPDSRP
jgi:hypothetical protein